MKEPSGCTKCNLYNDVVSLLGSFSPHWPPILILQLLLGPFQLRGSSVVRRLVTDLWSDSPRKNLSSMIPIITTDYCRTLWVRPRSISSTKIEGHFNWVKISNIVLSRLLRFYRQWFNKKETFPGWIDFKSFFCSNFMAQIFNTWYFNFFFSILKDKF